jgi:hypothetical protein
MRLRAWVAAMAMVLLAPALAQQSVPPASSPADKACLKQASRDHAVRRLDFWKGALDQPVLARVGVAPPALVDYLTLQNMLGGYPQRPKPATLDAAFLADLNDAIEDLPPQVWRLFVDRLAGIYLLDDLGGTGFTDVVADAVGRPAAGFIVLDAAVLGRLSANAWATWKEGTPFKPRDGYALAARIEAAAGDNRRNAIQYILLHELGHVLSIGDTIHPPWDVDPRDVPASVTYPFFNLSWIIDRQANRYAALPDADFPQRRNVAYYFGPKLDATDMVPTYANLERTNFPSLYAATHPGDDFAEAFASYVHVVLQRRPWQVLIYKDGALQKEFVACWDEPRCAAKRGLLEQMVGR